MDTFKALPPVPPTIISLHEVRFGENYRWLCYAPLVGSNSSEAAILLQEGPFEGASAVTLAGFVVQGEREFDALTSCSASACSKLLKGQASLRSKGDFGYLTVKNSFRDPRVNFTWGDSGSDYSMSPAVQFDTRDDLILALEAFSRLDRLAGDYILDSNTSSWMGESNFRMRPELDDYRILAQRVQELGENYKSKPLAEYLLKSIKFEEWVPACCQTCKKDFIRKTYEKWRRACYSCYTKSPALAPRKKEIVSGYTFYPAD